jgi:hypothetical protein
VCSPSLRLSSHKGNQDGAKKDAKIGCEKPTPRFRLLGRHQLVGASV